MRHLTAIVQLTDRCNLRCRYCYVPENGTDMSEETFRVLLDKMLDYVGEKGTISIIYHGGEPLLRGLDFFKSANALIEARGGRKRVDVSVQTNGTLITDDFADFLVRNKIPCGISLDGPRDIHDANRRSCKAGRGTFEKTMEGIKKLQSRGRKASAIAVLTKASLRKIPDMYNFFNEQEIDFKVNPVDLIGRSQAEKEMLEITPAEFGRALVELFDLWFDDKNTRITIGNLYDAMRSLASGEYSECIFSKRACGTHYLGIAPNGDVFPCNRFSSYDEFKLGNILKDPLDQMMGTKIFGEFGRRSESLKACASCKYRAFCNGGCTSRAYSHYHSVHERDLYCPSIKMLFGHVEERLEEVVEKQGVTL